MICDALMMGLAATVFAVCFFNCVFLLSRRYKKIERNSIFSLTPHSLLTISFETAQTSEMLKN